MVICRYCINRETYYLLLDFVVRITILLLLHLVDV